MILLLILICIIYPECEGSQPWIHPFPGFPSVFKDTGKLCVPEELKRKAIPTVPEPVQDGEPVFVNVYDLSLGWKRIYHSGVQVYGIEYSYNRINNVTGNAIKRLPAEEVPTRPGHFKFLKSITLGYTNLTKEEVERYVTTLGNEEFTGDKYKIFTHNCNDFSDRLTTILIGKGIPSWINRPALILRCLRIQRVITKLLIPTEFQNYF